MNDCVCVCLCLYAFMFDFVCDCVYVNECLCVREIESV